VFALYVALYTLGRSYIETLRVDPAREVLGLRFNVWTSVVLFAGAVIYIVVSARMRPGREVLSQPPPEPEPALAPADDIEHQQPR
jgi:prolipoprotein diacylglyceryltransferase